MMSAKRTANTFINNSSASSAKGDFVFTRMIILFLVMVAYTVFELYAHGNNVDVITASLAVNISSAVFAAAGVILAVIALVSLKNKRSESFKVCTPGFFAGICLALAVMLCLTYAVSAHSLIIIAFAAVALVFVGYTFSRDFFMLSAATLFSYVLASLPGMFLLPEGGISNLINYGSVALVAVIAVAFAALSFAACFGKNEKLSDWFFNMGYVRRYPLFVFPVIWIALSVIGIFAASLYPYALVGAIIVYAAFLIVYTFDSANS